MSRWKDFYIDQSPNGERYFIQGDLVPFEEFINRRDKECSHRKDEFGNCRDCGLSITVKRASRGER